MVEWSEYMWLDLPTVRTMDRFDLERHAMLSAELSRDLAMQLQASKRQNAVLTQRIEQAEAATSSAVTAQNDMASALRSSQEHVAFLASGGAVSRFLIWMRRCFGVRI